MAETELLREINRKMDALVALTKIGVSKELEALTAKIKKDKVSQKILELADGSLSSGDLASKVHELTGVSEITVKRRISELSEKGLILGHREGLKVFYTNSGIIEV
ncbi:MAG: hypothetical protein ACTSPV_14045 [Candidatus Hodarchaeales archaeon]